MQNKHLTVLFLLAFSFAVASLPAVAQVVVATVPTQDSPSGVAVNPQTNKIYVTNYCGNDPNCTSNGTVTVIDGATNTTSTVSVGSHPLSVVVNPVTNKIYVDNVCGNDPACNSFNGTVTVIDGATLATATVAVGFGYKKGSTSGLKAMAVDSVTNQIYVVNTCGSDSSCQSNGTVTVIDGATNNTTPVTVGAFPGAVAVNSVTNKIYVANGCGNDPTCQPSNGTVTVIDGATLSTASVTVGSGPNAVAVNALTNQIYVANFQSNSVTVIDGATNNTTPVTVGLGPYAVAVNAVTNEVYVVNYSDTNFGVTVINAANNNSTVPVPVGSTPIAVTVNPVTNKVYVSNFNSQNVTVIDGLTNSTVPVTVGSHPFGVAANPATNDIYVANEGDNPGDVSVIAGSSTGLQFVAVTPCRLVDTRPQHGGGGPIPGGTSESFILPQLGGCNIPTTAAAYSLNVTVVPSGRLGYLTIWPTGEDQPLVSTMNSLDGRIKANAAIVPAGYQGAVSVYVTDTTNVVIDIDGYFKNPGVQTLQFYPLAPCRVADTRKSTFPQGLGTPNLSAGVARDFPVLESPCIPSGITPAAYSFNFTVVPYPSLGYSVGYLEVWPTGSQPQNPVSTLNDQTGTIVANAAIVPAGTSGEITAYASNDTDLVIDIDGYFAPAGTGGLSLYPTVPCRVIDTRKVGNGQPFSGELTVDVVDSICAPPTSALAYVFNATVVPPGDLGFLTLWPDGGNQPLVSTLNAFDGAITSNMAIVPTTNGSIDAYASSLTQLILDISSYFAP